MSRCFLSLVQTWLPGMMTHVQQRYLDLVSEVEQWGVYDPYVDEMLLYLIVVIPLGYLAEGIPFALWLQDYRDNWKKWCLNSKTNEISNLVDEEKKDPYGYMDNWRRWCLGSKKSQISNLGNGDEKEQC